MNRVNLITAVLAVAIVGLLSSFLANVSGTSITDSFSTAVKQDTPALLQVTTTPAAGTTNTITGAVTLSGTSNNVLTTPASGAVTVIQGTSGGTAVATLNTTAAATVSRVSDATATNALAANANRIFWYIQNNSTNVLYVQRGTTCASTNYDRALRACTAAKDGAGGEDGDSYWKGAISVSGTSPNYNIIEMVK